MTVTHCGRILLAYSNELETVNELAWLPFLTFVQNQEGQEMTPSTFQRVVLSASEDSATTVLSLDYGILFIFE